MSISLSAFFESQKEHLASSFSITVVSASLGLEGMGSSLDVKNESPI